MNGLVISDVIKDLIINIINIIVLFVIVRALVYNPVKKFLQARIEKIEKTKADADALKQGAEEDAKKYTDLLNDSNKKSVEIVSDAERVAKNNATQIVDNAKQKASDILMNAEKQIEEEKTNMLHSMKDDIKGLAFNISKQILSREVSNDDNKKIADDFFSDLKLSEKTK